MKLLLCEILIRNRKKWAEAKFQEINKKQLNKKQLKRIVHYLDFFIKNNPNIANELVEDTSLLVQLALANNNSPLVRKK